MGILRQCKCGTKACDSEDLELFVSRKKCKYGRGNLCKVCSNRKGREEYLSHNYKQKLQTLKRYGVTIEDYEKAMATSDCCGICNSKNNLCYDHDHITMKFRGVLCRRCNRSLGQLGDTLESVLKVVKYLEK